MANEQNLVPFTSDQSREKAAKNGAAGGIASGKARREKKTLADALRKVLDEKDAGTGLTRRELIAAKVLRKLFDDGDIRDVKALAEVLGELKQTFDVQGLQLNVNASKEGAEGIDRL